ncbi:exodeoxyribonuclease VII small subunit [Luteolibacter algae]|uniref:Exodeoxyribonuclease 7 small subunit n=1 Tax=Luteolibacter algae TaxID=454151 RepID=A0ABW5D8L3_9BACT
MPARKKKDPASAESELSFESALAKIEDIVESMEGDQLPLEDLVDQYEAGSKLLKHCEAVLSSARRRIELITLTDREEAAPSGKAEPLPYSLNASDENSEDLDDDNDISLF